MNLSLISERWLVQKLAMKAYLSKGCKMVHKLGEHHVASN